MLNVLGDDGDENDEDGEEPSPSCGDYVMHFLTLFWKILFAFIPPTGNLLRFLTLPVPKPGVTSFLLTLCAYVQCFTLQVSF